MSNIIIEKDEQVTTITINRPQVRNAVDGETAEELATCLAHWQAATAEESGRTYSPREYPDRIKRTVMAEKTGEPYSFWEYMPAYDNYVPDLQPSDVDARTRGLDQVCLVLFNLNEFAYVD